MQTFFKGLLVVCAAMLGAATATAAAPKHCIEPKRVQVGTGTTPDEGKSYGVRAEVRNNGHRCDDWLFQVQFRFPGIVSFAAGTSIPVDGHTPPGFPISALDALSPEGPQRVFAGYTGSAVAKVVAQLEDGTRQRIIPRFPSKALRNRNQWLRGFRYFVQFYEGEVGVERVSLFSDEGRLIYRSSSSDGVF